MRSLSSPLVIALLIIAGAGCNQATPLPEIPNPLNNTTTSATAEVAPRKLAPAVMTLQNGKQLSLSLENDYRISVAAQGYRRLRFMAKSPDDRLFVGEMFDPGDTNKGHVYIFDHFDPATKTFTSVHTYLSGLRNPNSIVFYTDTSGKTWLYVALTDKLIRYAYTVGDNAPTEAPQLVATFPAYGRSWSQGGWHITRTLAVYQHKIYVSVGSSCNSCEEKDSEPSRASIVEMDPDGSHQIIYANGMRNAVGIRFVDDELYATVNGPDHLGDDHPEDTFFRISKGTNYGWPYCYQLNGKILPDSTQKWTKSFDCKTVPLAHYGIPPHSAPLGFDAIEDRFLVALHGAGKKALGAGYKIISITKQGEATDFLTGFLSNGNVSGRPVDILKNDNHSFFVTDDFNGVMYYMEKTTNE